MLSFSTCFAPRKFRCIPKRESDNQIGLDGRMRWVKSPESNYSDNELMRFTVRPIPSPQRLLKTRKTALMWQNNLLRLYMILDFRTKKLERVQRQAQISDDSTQRGWTQLLYRIIGDLALSTEQSKSLVDLLFLDFYSIIPFLRLFEIKEEYRESELCWESPLNHRFKRLLADHVLCSW